MILVHKFMLKDTFLFFLLKFIALQLVLVCASFTYMGHHVSCHGGWPRWPVGTYAEVGRSYPLPEQAGQAMSAEGGDSRILLPPISYRVCLPLITSQRCGGRLDCTGGAGA